MRRSRSPASSGAAYSSRRPADLAGHGLGGEGVEIVEVPEHRALGHPGALGDAGGAGLGLALVEELEQRGDDQLASPLRAQSAPVDRSVAPGPGILRYR